MPGIRIPSSARRSTWRPRSPERGLGAQQILVFQHHPYFIEDAKEEDDYFNIPASRRALYLELFQQVGVHAVFAGHHHRNAHGWAGDLERLTTGPVGMPLGEDPSGFRIVRVGPQGLDHAYYGLESIPEGIGLR